MLDSNIVKPFDDSLARAEWGWTGRYDLRQRSTAFWSIPRGTQTFIRETERPRTPKI